MSPLDRPDALPRRDFLKRGGAGLAALALSAELAGAEALLPLPRQDAPRAPQEPLRVGVLGTGARGREAIEELQQVPGVALLAVCDEDPGRLKGAQRRAPDAAATADPAEFFATDGLQAVVVCTPTHRHREAVEAGLRRALHVYCETPLAHRAEDARVIVAAAAAGRAQGRVHAAGATARANPLYRRVRDLFSTGGIARHLGATIHVHRRDSWRAAAPDPARERARNWRLDPEVSLGLAGEAAAHHLDFLLWATGKTPTEVRGRGELLLWDDGRAMPDNVHLQLPLAGGGTWTADLSLANSHGDAQVHVHGSAGTVRAVETNAWLFKESDAPNQGWEVYATRVEQLGHEGLVLLANATKLAAQDKLKAGIGLEHSPFWYALDDFVGACLEGRAPACTPDDALPATLLAQAAAEAVRGGAPVPLDAATWPAD